MPFPILGLIAGAQAVYGAIKANGATNDFNAAMKDRKPIKTPDELYKVLQATQANAQGGFDATTLQYLTSQNDRSFSSSLEILKRMGGDPNNISALFDQNIQNIIKVGEQNHALNLENVSKYFAAEETIANAKVAEQVSQQDIVKDKLQASNANKQAAFANIQSGVNLGVQAYEDYRMDKLYGGSNPNDKNNWKRSVTGSGKGSYTLGNADPTAPPTSIIKDGRTYTWNAYSQKYE